MSETLILSNPTKLGQLTLWSLAAAQFDPNQTGLACQDPGQGCRWLALQLVLVRGFIYFRSLPLK